MEYRPNASHNKITFYVFDANGDRVPEVELDSAGPKAVDVPDMPHAEVTREKFWQSPARGHLIGALNLPTACDGS